MNEIENYYHYDARVMSTSDHQTERASTFPPSGDVEFRHLRPALGTFVAVSGRVADARNVRPGVEAAYEAIERVGALMHPTCNDSDLTSIRTSSIGRAIAVHCWTWEVLCWSQRLNALSGGRFDPCVPESAGRIRDIDLPAPGVVVCRAPVAIDLGGIAKGFAVDRAVDALIAAGCSEGQVNAGGDVRCFGPAPATIWLRIVGLARPIELRDRACATSDPAQAQAPSGHRGYYRPGAGGPVSRRAAVVVASTTLIADALTKCVLLSDGATHQTELEALLQYLGAVALDID